MTPKEAFRLRSVKTLSLILTVLVVSSYVSNANAQTSLGYRQRDLTSHLSRTPSQSEFLINPWGMAFLPGGNFFVAENAVGRVDSYDANGVLGVGLSLPLPVGSTAAHSRPTGIVADPDENLFIGNTHFRFFAATEEGTIVAFNLDSNGQPIDTRIVVDRSSAGAIYTGIALLHPACCRPVLTVANFHSGDVEVYGLSQVALPGAFQDPNLPAGYAPFNIQTIGDITFVTYAKQDATKQSPIFGLGNGVVSLFHQDGTFFSRFVSDGERLNAPWGVTLAPSTFGPFPSKILIGNAGDGRVGVYDPGTGELLSTLLDSEGRLIVNEGLRALTFRADGVGDPDFLYLVAAPPVVGGQNGLFADVQVGRLTQTQLFADEAPLNVEVNLTARVNTVSGGDIPTGSVLFFDNDVIIGIVNLNAGSATLAHTYSSAGIHNVVAEYQGTDNLLKSFDRQPVRVLGPATTTTLGVDPTSAPSGAPVTFTARTQATGVVPTGTASFLEGNTLLGTAPLDGTGTAHLTLANLASGAHSVTASFSGNNLFQDSSSAPVLVNIGGDFQFTPNVPSITVGRGSSSDVMLTVSPRDGFNGAVTFNCLAPAGISCTFNPATINVTQNPATSRLTVTASTAATNKHEGLGLPFLTFGAFGTVLLGFGRKTRAFLMVGAILTLGLFLVACGGYNKQASGTPPHTATITLSATAGSVSHSTTVSVTVQ